MPCHPACTVRASRWEISRCHPASNTFLVRRRDHVEVIVSAIEAKAGGESRARIASRLGRHVDTVRGWLRAFARNAEAIRSLFTRWALALDPLGAPIEPEQSAFGDALSAIGVAVRASVLRFGQRPFSRSVQEQQTRLTPSLRRAPPSQYTGLSPGSSQGATKEP